MGKKGQIAWNKGLTKETDARVAQYARNLVGRIPSPETRRKLSNNPNAAWSKGLTTETSEGVRKRTQTQRERLLSGQIIPWNRGKRNLPQLKGKTGVRKWTPEMHKKIPPRISAGKLKPEARQRNSEMMKDLWQQDWYRNKVTAAVVAASHKRPSNLEQQLIDIIVQFNLPYLYVGDGSYPLIGRNPDFISYDETKVVEVWGEHWHTGRWLRETPEERTALFRTKGVSTLIIFGEAIEVYNEKKLAALLIEFSRTGISSIVRANRIEVIPLVELTERMKQRLMKPKRKVQRADINRRTLGSLYLEQWFTISKVAESLKCSSRDIVFWLREYGIPIRAASEYRKGKKINWADKIREGHLRRQKAPGLR